MDKKNLVAMAAAAAVLCAAAYLLSSGSRPSAAKLNGKTILPALDMSAVSRIEIGGRLALAAGDGGWVVETLHGYPADRAKIAENLLKLAELKVGQVARGRDLGETTEVVLKDAAGKELAKLPLGDRHRGRYVGFEGQTVLVSDTLDAFDGDPKRWCDARIANFPASDVTAVAFSNGDGKFELEKGTNGVWEAKGGLAENEELDSSKTYSLDSALSYLDFASVADPALTEAELGFSTGFVYTATMKDGTNSVVHVATVGNEAKEGGGRYFRLDDGKWVFVIPQYAAEKMMRRRSDLVKEKEKPKDEDSGKAGA